MGMLTNISYRRLNAFIVGGTKLKDPAKYFPLLPECILAINTLQKTFNMDFCLTSTEHEKHVNDLLKMLKERHLHPKTTVASINMDIARHCPFILACEVSQRLQHPLKTIVKLDCTEQGIQDGLDAGCWTIGVVK